MFRETFAVVDVRAIEHNVAAIKRILRPGTRLLVAVKANGYGHGAAVAARAALRGGATHLGVASVEEGIALRSAGIDAPILVLGAVTSAWAAAVAAQAKLAITLTADCLRWPHVHFEPALSVHLKVDTGMTRLGCRTPEECARIADWVAGRSDVVLAGVFTHLACADDPASDHSAQQMQRFDEIVKFLRGRGHHPELVHAANSAGTLRSQEWHLDMVRIGIAAYGYAPSPAFPLPIALRPALHLYSFATRVEQIEPGMTVGYGATFKARRPTRVATFPVGYGDGYFRSLSNKARVVIHGQSAPVVGNVCMDQLMVDVTDIPEVETGVCATLFGLHAPLLWRADALAGLTDSEQRQWIAVTFRAHSDSAPVLSVDELASAAGTISYELLCAVSQRVPRIPVE